MPGTWQTRQVPPTSQVGPPRRLHSEPRVYLLKQVFGAHYSQESSATGVGGRRPRDAHLTTQCSVTALTGSPGMPGCGDHHRLSTCSTAPPRARHGRTRGSAGTRQGEEACPCGPGQGPSAMWATAVRLDGPFPWSGHSVPWVFLHPESSSGPKPLPARCGLVPGEEPTPKGSRATRQATAEGWSSFSGPRFPHLSNGDNKPGWDEFLKQNVFQTSFTPCLLC